MIDQVEDLPAELEKLRFHRREILAQADIGVPETRIAQQVALLHPEGPRRRLGERRLIEPDRRIGEGGRRDIRVAYQIPELIAAAGAHSRVIHILAHREWSPRLRLEN